MRTMGLPVRLTDEEVLTRALELSGTHQELLKEEASFNEASSNFRARKKALEAEEERLFGLLKTRSEVREVEVREVRNREQRTVQLYRCDTDELVDSRPMNEAELGATADLFAPAEPEGTLGDIRSFRKGKAGKKARHGPKALAAVAEFPVQAETAKEEESTPAAPGATDPGAARPPDANDDSDLPA